MNAKASESQSAGVWPSIVRCSSLPASRRFVCGALLASFIVSFGLWEIGTLDFTDWAASDAGAALRADALIAAGKRPGIDFGYYYGLLPLLVFRAVVALVPNHVVAMLTLGALASIIVGLSECAVVWKARPTRLGTMIIACLIPHTMIVEIPTHALEAALLSAGVGMLALGKRPGALVCTSLAVFAKVSMASVLLTTMTALVACDAIRLRSSRPLRDLIAPAATLVVGILVLGGWFGFSSLRAVMDPHVGAEVYRASHLGFFKPEGLAFWWGRSPAWYVGSIAGIWLIGTVALFGLGARASIRLARSLRAGASSLSREDELLLIGAAGHLAFIFAFFPGYGYFAVHYYTWLMFMALAPVVAGAGSECLRQQLTPIAWLALAAFSLLGNRLLVLPKVRALRQPVVAIAGFTGAREVVAQWDEAKAAAHRRGRVAALGRGAHFSIIDPAIAEGPYWMLLPGLSQARAIDVTMGMLAGADAVIVLRQDADLLREDPDQRVVGWFARAPRILENEHFLVLRGGGSGAESTPRN